MIRRGFLSIRRPLSRCIRFLSTAEEKELLRLDKQLQSIQASNAKLDASITTPMLERELQKLDQEYDKLAKSNDRIESAKSTEDLDQEYSELVEKHKRIRRSNDKLEASMKQKESNSPPPVFVVIESDEPEEPTRKVSASTKATEPVFIPVDTSSYRQRKKSDGGGGGTGRTRTNTFSSDSDDSYTKWKFFAIGFFTAFTPQMLIWYIEKWRRDAEKEETKRFVLRAQIEEKKRQIDVEKERERKLLEESVRSRGI